MKKNYIIRKTQLDELVRVKKERKLVAEQIMIEISSAKTNLKEATFQNEAVADILRKYFKRGNLTKPVARILIESGIKNNDLLSAGIIFKENIL